jgi:hypothetical protein
MYSCQTKAGRGHTEVLTRRGFEQIRLREEKKDNLSVVGIAGPAMLWQI